MFDAGSWYRSSCWSAAGRSLREAEVGRVVECSWTIVAGSWGRLSCWMQLVDRCGKLRSVETLKCSWTIVAGSWGRSSRRMQLDDRCRKLVSVESWLVNRCPGFWQYVGLTGDVSIWLLARTASRTEASCCNAKAVRNSESFVDWILHCWSVVVEVSVGSLVM